MGLVQTGSVVGAVVVPGWLWTEGGGCRDGVGLPAGEQIEGSILGTEGIGGLFDGFLRPAPALELGLEPVIPGEIGGIGQGAILLRKSCCLDNDIGSDGFHFFQIIEEGGGQRGGRKKVATPLGSPVVGGQAVRQGRMGLQDEDGLRVPR